MELCPENLANQSVLKKMRYCGRKITLLIIAMRKGCNFVFYRLAWRWPGSGRPLSVVLQGSARSWRLSEPSRAAGSRSVPPAPRVGAAGLFWFTLVADEAECLAGPVLC